MKRAALWLFGIVAAFAIARMVAFAEAQDALTY